MPDKVSESSRVVVVELVGPLVDDRGAVVGTIGQTLAGAGVELRPGAIDQVAGAELDWALRTLLEGHGRDDLLAEMESLSHRVLEGWKRLASSQELRLALGGAEAWARFQRQEIPVLLLSGLPPVVVRSIADRFQLAALAPRLVREGEGASGLPRPDALRAALAELGVAAANAVAGVSSPAGVLGSVAAGCGNVIQVGLPTGIAAGMPVDSFVGRLDELLPAI